MRTPSPRRLVLLAVLLMALPAALLSACNRASPAAGTAEPTPIAAATDPALQAVVSAESATVISLAVEGGPREGSYEVVLDETSCSYGLMGGDSWGNQYSTLTDDPEAFSSLQLIVPSTAEAATGTSDFLTTITFGELFAAGGTSYTIDGRSDGNPRGEGTVTIRADGDAATVIITGETEDGIKIHATIHCNDVFRIASPGEPAGDTAAPVATVATLTIDGETQTFQAGDEEASCGYGESDYGFYEGENGWYYGLYRETDDGLFMFDLFVPESGTAEGTRTFYLSLEGGAYEGDGYQHIIYNDADYESGAGTATVEDDGDTVTIRVQGETDDGTVLEMTVRCEGVER